VATEVRVSSYVIVGSMHTEAWQELLEILDSEERFLPLTGVRITPALATGDAEFDFVAVNKARIDYLGQPPRRPPAAIPGMRPAVCRLPLPMSCRT
jgi:hypothetical protein